MLPPWALRVCKDEICLSQVWNGAIGHTSRVKLTRSHRLMEGKGRERVERYGREFENIIRTSGGGSELAIFV